MGIGTKTLRHFLDLKKQGILDGIRAVFEIGSQEMYCHDGEAVINELVAAFGQPAAKPEIVKGIANMGSGRDFYRLLGLDYNCIDTDGRFGALALDLNYDSVPAEHQNRYDLLTNFGTTEHVVNQLNCFKVIHELTAPGGYMYHELPFTGYVTHGLVNYTPKFFWMLCRSNFYDYVGMWVDADTQRRFLHPDILGDAKIKVEVNEGNFSQQDSCLRCLVRKRFDIPYVAPLDGDLQGVDEKVLRRYWTVTDKGSFARVAAGDLRSPTEQVPAGRVPGKGFLRTLAGLFRRGASANSAGRRG
jgi:hypothetical protein